MGPIRGKDFGIPENLAELINKKFNDALSQNEIVYVESKVDYRQGKAFNYQIRIVPAFSNKPHDIQDQAQKPCPDTQGKGNALLEVPPERIIAEAGPFRIILNKYCAVKNQILLVSTTPRLQSETLESCELASVYHTLKTLPQNHLAFYNCGRDSGASQPQKHVQIVPLDSKAYHGLFPVNIISKRASTDPEDQPIIMLDPDVPYTHFVVQPTEECTGPYLQSLFLILLSATKSALAKQLRVWPTTPAYNFLMTPDWLMMIPRTRACWNEIGANSLGMLGVLWLSSDEQLQRWSTVGFDDILTNVGVRKIEAE